ncbi:MAG: C-type lectin domain-containing protein [bacterium]|nr:C-type lectin domain-containing protein [bacterium]
MGAREHDGGVSDADPLCGDPQIWSTNDHEYWVCSPVKLSWFAAKLYCRSLDAYLVTVASAEENTHLTSLLSGSDSAWIGASDDETEGAWLWVENEGYVYTNWSGGTPSNGEWNYDCAAISQTDGTWSDEICGERRTFICEFAKK